MDTGRAGRGWDELREALTYKKRIGSEKLPCSMQRRELSSGLCDDPEGWEGGWGGDISSVPLLDEGT